MPEAPRVSPIFAAARAGDVDGVRRELAQGASPDGAHQDPGSPLWAACAGEAPDERRLETARLLLAAGAATSDRRAGEVALHAAARRGPLALVELLIAGGAIEWLPDDQGRAPAAVATDPAIAGLLERPVIRDPVFREAVAALHAGDAAALARLLDAHPRLLSERIEEPECYRQARRAQYFHDPKLFWFVADNPDLVTPMPAGMVDCAREMIARGVDQDDLDYALELTMTSGPAREAGLTAPLMRLLLDAGATATERAVTVTLAHAMVEPVELLLAAGHPVTLPIAAALGRLEDLEARLAAAPPAERQAAFGLAVINRQVEAARRLLAAGAEVDAFLPVHSHSTALHQAAINDDVPMLELLTEHGARRDIADMLWSGTPLQWAAHAERSAATAYLERLG